MAKRDGRSRSNLRGRRSPPFPLRGWIAAAVLFLAPLGSGCGKDADAVERTGTAREASGVKGVRAGAPCDIRIAPESRGGFDCRMTLRCAGITLYGGEKLGGYGDCEVREGRYASAADPRLSSKDGDPSIRIDLAAGEAVFADDRPEQRVVVALDPAPP